MKADELFAYWLVTVAEQGETKERGFSSPVNGLEPYSDECPVVVGSNQAIRPVEDPKLLDQSPCQNPGCGLTISYFACHRCTVCGEKVLPLGACLRVP